ncbi:MAG: WS/DGAT domain-containing protein, partial [Planctomycetota bacterium]
LAALVERIESSPREFAVNVSNVPGPRHRVSVLGAPVESLHSIAEIGLRHGLRITAVSLADRLYFGFNADPALVPEVEWLAEGVEIEAGELIGLAS